MTMMIYEAYYIDREQNPTSMILLYDDRGNRSAIVINDSKYKYLDAKDITFMQTIMYISDRIYVGTKLWEHVATVYWKIYSGEIITDAWRISNYVDHETMYLVGDMILKGKHDEIYFSSKCPLDNVFHEERIDYKGLHVIFNVDMLDIIGKMLIISTDETYDVVKLIYKTFDIDYPLQKTIIINVITSFITYKDVRSLIINHLTSKTSENIFFS